MDRKHYKRVNRKRKYESNDTEYIVPKCRNRPFTEEAQMEEEELSKDLFGDNSGFLKTLEEVELHSYETANVDSGIGETETETEGSNDEDSALKPAWHDEDDGIDVGNALGAQHRRLPNGGINARSAQYLNMLEHKFQSLVGTPKWAAFDKHTNDSGEELLQTTKHLAKVQTSSLQPGDLEFKKVNDLNLETYNEGPKITTIEFHPTSTVALVGGVSGVVSLFAVDGKRNNKLHSLALTNYPVECGRFVQDTEALFGSRHSHFFAFDLHTTKTSRIRLPNGVTNCKNFEVSPCRKYVAVCGKWGEVHLLTANSKELISTLKQNSNATSLSFTADGSQLFGHSDTGEVTIWDLGTRRIIHKWTDEGCLKGTTLTISPSGEFIATGSAQGVVNVYDTDLVLKQENPKPRKTIFNLTTYINSLQFNHTSELLALGSNALNNSIRLFHVASGTVFKNFPTSGTKMGRINTLAFSPASGYAAFGSLNSTVALYRLKHYKNY